MDDSSYNEILYLLKHQDYPIRIKNIANLTVRKSEKRKLRSKSKDYNESNGMLYKGHQKVLRQNETEAVLQNLHSGEYAGGHLGRDKTYHKVSEYYYWKGLKEDIRNFVRDCDVCSRVTIAPPKTAPPLNPIPVPSQVWSLIGVDRSRYNRAPNHNQPGE